MEKRYVKENRKSYERLRKLVNEMTDEELKLVIYKEGWTVAAALAHLAFWDERRRVLIRKWQRRGITREPFYEHTINNALLPLLLAIPPREAANLVIITAEALDRELENISPALESKIKSLKDHHALNRAIHRKMHLDEIEALLKSKRET